MRRTLALLVTAVLLLASCSSDDDSEAGESGDPVAETTTSTTEPAAEPIDDQAAPATINGIDVDGDTIWIASIEADELVQVRRTDGAILARYPTEGAGPDDVAVAPDGTVWSTGFGNGDVGRVTDGSYEVVTTIEPGINPIAIDDEGMVWIGTFGTDGYLYVIDPSNLPDDASSGSWEPVATGLPDINAFGILDDGTIVAPAGGIAGPGSAIAIDPETGEFETIVEGLPAVAAGTTDAEGTPYVLANVTGEVFRIDVEAGTAESIRTVADGAPFDNLAFAEDGTLYLSSFIAPTITEVAPDGTVRVIDVGDGA
jgi:hypothetical protein